LERARLIFPAGKFLLLMRTERHAQGRRDLGAKHSGGRGREYGDGIVRRRGRQLINSVHIAKAYPDTGPREYVIPRSDYVSVTVVVFGTLLRQAFIPYNRYVRFLKWLTLCLLAYAAVLCTIHVPWGQVALRTVWPHFSPNAAAAAAVAGARGLRRLRAVRGHGLEIGPGTKGRGGARLLRHRCRPCGVAQIARDLCVFAPLAPCTRCRMKYDAQSIRFSDETIMRMLVGLVGTALMLSVGAFAQHVSGGAHGGISPTVCGWGPMSTSCTWDNEVRHAGP